MQPPNSLGLLEDLITSTTWTTFPHEDPSFVHSFGDNTANEENDPYLASIQLQPILPNLNGFAPVNVSDYGSFEQQMYEYSDVLESTVVGQGDDRIHEEQHLVVSDDKSLSGIGSGEKKSKYKKLGGQPSKNLMAERRRRKRLNDRLSMLRSIVPRISKMDRTSILVDTIEYMKELLERISTLKGQNNEFDSNSLNLMGSSKESILNETKARNQPKFVVERRDMDTCIQIRCSMRPGLLLSTVNALEVLGLDVQQCVISCFGDFSLQASCSEAPGYMMTSSEEIKQILIRNACCGGRSF